MTVLLDANAVIAFILDEPAADDVESLLDNEGIWMTSVNVAEVVDKLARTYSRNADDIEADLAMLEIAIEPVETDLALAAGRVRASYYHRRDCAVSLADCIAAVAALGSGSRLATADADLAMVADDLGVTIEPLPNSQGVRPTVDAVSPIVQ